MTAPLEDIIETFQSVDEETRLDLLLDYSRRLPDLPTELVPLKEAGAGRVPECMTPVFLYIEMTGDEAVQMHAFVGDEAPTIRGFLGILHSACDGEPPAAMKSIPDDLVARLGLGKQIRMNRLVGITAMIGRLRRRATELMGAAS